MRNKAVLLLVSALLATAPSWDAAAGLAAQEDPWARGSVGTGLLLRRLDGVKRVLMIGAHPDDEDTALLAALSRGMGVETAYLSLTRGEGGQNLLGPELDEGLGLVRTGDPTRFPEQMARGAEPWTPQKLYRLTRRDPREGTIGIETGAFDPLLGRSHFQVAMDSRSQHRSQDMGVAQPMGPRRSTVALVKSRVEVEGPDEIFAGVDTTVLSLAKGLPEPVQGNVEGQLAEYRAALAEAWEALGAMEPWRATPALGRAVEALGGIAVLVNSEGGPPFGGWAGAAVEWFLSERIPLVQEAFLRSAGVVWDVRIEDDLLCSRADGQRSGGAVEWRLVHSAACLGSGPDSGGVGDRRRDRRSRRGRTGDAGPLEL